VFVCRPVAFVVVVVFPCSSQTIKKIFREFLCLFLIRKREETHGKRSNKQDSNNNNNKKREKKHTCKATKEKANKRERESANCVSDAKKFKNINNAHNSCFIFDSPKGLKLICASIFN